MSAKNRLRKSISTRFVRSSHNSSPTAEPFDPELARVFATAAASRAMSRSLYRPSDPSDGSYDRLGGPHRMAVPSRRYKRSTYSGFSSATDDHPIRHSASSSTGSSEHDQPWSAALPSISEFGGLEDRVASLPSSYRRLRRSRSMFSTRQRSSQSPYGSTPHESYSTNVGSRVAASDQPRLYRTLRRSMSFLRSDDRPQNTLRHAKSHDVAIQLARSQYDQSHMNSPDSSNWAPLPISKVRREHKPFRKTFRGMSTSESSPATASIEHVRTSQAHGKARAFSSSIKKGIKRVLGLSRNVSEQGSAQESPSSSHWGQSPSTEISNEVEYSGDRASFDVDNPHERASTSRPPTVRRMQSSGSLATSRSRVTSWADSTAANTIGTPSIGGQRLSIISEQGKLGQADVHPLPSTSIGHGPSSAVDSHRLFSALMKRIGGTNMQPPEEDIVIGQVKEHRAIPTQGSLRFQRIQQTIRQVPSDTSISSPKSFATANPGPITPYGQPHGRAANARSTMHSAEGYRNDNSTVRKENLRPESVSSSIYSRSTNGHSPRPNPTADSPNSAAEPGVATIYASERTVYSSPGKVAGTSNADISAQTGTDWHNWMDSQISRIENTTPTGYHYREDAQIQDDYETGFASSVPARRIRVESRGIAQPDDDHDELGRKVSTNSNFSRPFSRSSSLRTVVKIRNPSPNVPTPSIPTLLADDVFRDSPEQDHSLKFTQAGQSTGVSPMLSRSSNQPRIVESPTPKRPTTDVSPKMISVQHGQYSSKWSPGTQDTRTLHRRSARALRESRRATNENARLEQSLYDQAYGLQSPMSSKRMVEIFLNSRRRQTGGDVSNDGASEPAFL
ncbi:hypothetical protein BDV12DRAFT_30277 [Aspergillus spectabilis]